MEGKLSSIENEILIVFNIKKEKRMTKKIIIICYVLSFLHLRTIFPVQNKVKWLGQIEKHEGYISIINPKEPIYQNNVLNLKEELAFGGREEKRQKYLMENIKQIDIDEQGNFFILDINTKEIRVFDENGDYKSSIGRIGQGPGEFQWPWMIHILDHTGIVVLDFLPRKLLYYSLDGIFKKKVNIALYGNCSKFVINAKGDLIAQFVLNNLGSALKKVNLEAEEIETITKKENKKTPLLKAISPKIVWTVNQDDQILWGISDRYQIYIYDDKGSLVKKIVKPFKRLKIKKEEKEEFENEIQKIFGRRPIPTNFEQEIPKYYPAFQAIYTDEDGKIFVKTYEKNKEGQFYFDVFDQQGRYLAKIALNTKYQVWKKHKLYSIELDREGYQVIKRYNVEWKYK